MSSVVSSSTDSSQSNDHNENSISSDSEGAKQSNSDESSQSKSNSETNDSSAGNSSAENANIQQQEMTQQAVTISLPPPPQFDVEVEGGRANATRWKKWMGEFSIYLTATKITNDAQKKAVLLHLAGGKVQEIYNLKSTEQTNTFEQAVKLLDDHFAPAENKDFATLHLRQLRQEQGEGIDAFLVRLRKSAEPCGFGPKLDDELKLQLLAGCLDDRVRREAASKKDSTLKTLSDFASSLEIMPVLVQGNQNLKKELGSSRVETAHQVQAKTPFHRGGRSFAKPQPGSTCGNCGLALPHEKGVCPAKNAECNKCRRTGHFKRVCR